MTFAHTLGVHHRTAWAMLQRFGVAMVRAERELVSGDVEGEETFVGGVDHGGKRGRGARKCIVVVARELRIPKGFGRVRLRQVPDASGDSLVFLVCETLAPGSMVLTDAWGGDKTSSRTPAPPVRCRCRRRPIGSRLMPGVQRVARLTKGWMLGTHPGSVDPAHLQTSLEAHVPVQPPKLAQRGLVFQGLLEQAVATGPVTEADVTHGYDWGRATAQDVAVGGAN